MIFFSQNKNKFFALVVLTIIFTSFIVWQWWQLKPWGENLGIVKNSFDFPEASSTKAEIQNSWELGKIQLENLNKALQREQQEAEIVDFTKKYLNNLSSTTASTTLSTTTVE